MSVSKAKKGELSFHLYVANGPADFWVMIVEDTKVKYKKILSKQIIRRKTTKSKEIIGKNLIKSKK